MSSIIGIAIAKVRRSHGDDHTPWTHGVPHTDQNGSCVPSARGKGNDCVDLHKSGHLSWCASHIEDLM
jgi:hypothetical protein